MFDDRNLLVRSRHPYPSFTEFAKRYADELRHKKECQETYKRLMSPISVGG